MKHQSVYSRTASFPVDFVLRKDQSRGRLLHLFINFLFLFSPVFVWCQGVTVTEIDENIPTYLSGPPEPNPMFFFGKGTQGAEQRIYPYPLFDNLTNRKGEKTYHLVYLENKYIKIGIAPELGGKIFSAVDKTNNYDFIYRQHVVKPALIGLLGAWISGGVEWNIPHHHRASTFSPVQYKVEKNADGSKTVWIGELEIRHRMRWAVGYTLKPGSSVLQCKVRISNRTPIENTMLCFANIAVSVNDGYQVIFPPHTQWSTGHSKRAFNPWPVVNGVDVSWYKNNKSANSWFAVNYEDDFVAGYDHGRNAGILSIANHHVVAGKKFFTWGVGNMWDKILTDNDGPYLEIMVGAYSDNQPDYSWLQPNEERSFVMSLFPFRGIDGVKNANVDAAVNLEVKDGKIVYGFYTTRAFPDALVTIKAGSRVLLSKRIFIDPSKPFAGEFILPRDVDEHELNASISSAGQELVAYSPVSLSPVKRPKSYTEPLRPEQIKNTEELFLAGQRIDQFHNPAIDADPYWAEVIKRDSENIAANTGMGILSLRRAKYREAESYFTRAIDRLTDRYTTPKNVEPIYYLGFAQKEEGKLDEAFSTLYKATWKQEWKAPAFFLLGEIACYKADYKMALELVNQSLDANGSNVNAYVLKSALLRHLGRDSEALKVIALAKHKCDPLDAQLMSELWLCSKGRSGHLELFSTLMLYPVNAQELAASYMNCGLWKDGIEVLSHLVSQLNNKSKISPLIYYYLAYFSDKTGDRKAASSFRKLAALQPSEYVFPYQREMIPVLQSAIKMSSNDARAPYYLGNLLYDWQPEEAVRLWELSTTLDPNAPISWRNLAIAYSHKDNKEYLDKAIFCMEKAINLKDPYPAHFAELDQLYKLGKVPVAKRLSVMEKSQNTVIKKDEALGYLINLKIFTGKTDEAISLLQNRVFSIWEGGGAFRTGEAWADAQLVSGLAYFKGKNYEKALTAFQSALIPPENLRADGRNSRFTQIKYWTARSFEAFGEKEKALQLYREIIASDTLRGEGTRSRFAGARQLQRYYVALSQKMLNQGTDIDQVFRDLCDTTKNMNSNSSVELDYQFIRENSGNSSDAKAFSHFLAGLGFLGLGDKEKAKEQLNTALQIAPDFLSAQIELNQLEP